MRLIEVGVHTLVRIPEGWDYFVWNGIVHRKDAFGRWVIDRKIDAKKTA
jgi:hypothetical protein